MIRTLTSGLPTTRRELDRSNGTRTLVMELVEGPTLAERIKQEGISLEEALPIAQQICEGLE